MKWFNLLILSILSGLLLSLGWPERGNSSILFFSLVPLLFIEDYFLTKSKKHKTIQLFFYSYLSFLIWNVLTTWWVIKSTIFGGLSAFLLNTFLMSFAFYIFHLCRRNIKNKFSIFFLIPLWISFEYFHLDWDLSWPWLNLGNAFANAPELIQWYEFTGNFGGCIWILLSNIFIFLSIKSFINNNSIRVKYSLIIASLLLIFIPILISKNIYKNYKEDSDAVKVVIVQPNIDPYNEKFSLPFDIQTDRMINLSYKEIDSITDFLVFPESAIQENVWEKRLNSSYSIKRYKNDLIKKYPNLNIIIGASSFKMFSKNEKLSKTARKFSGEDLWYDAYNSAFLINNSDKIQIYHKSKLVPGVEKMPFPELFKPFEKFAINLGGTTGSLGTSNHRTPFLSNKSLKLATVICYESIYGELCSKFVKNGATLLFVITNDGWWGNSPGYKQHFEYSRLRAVENRRSIVRAANTGRSGFINQRGDVIEKTAYWKEAVIKNNVNLNNKLTFYSKHGDYLGRISAVIAVLIILISLFLRIFKKN